MNDNATSQPASDGQSIRALFDAAQQIPAPDRKGWVAAQNLSDTQRDRLLAMLAAADDSGTFPGGPVREWFISEDEDDWLDPNGMVGNSLGGFVIEKLIGQGGMALVYQAHREQTDFDQRVALKVLRGGLHSNLEQRLFRRERQVLAALSHPNIARLIDGGVTDSGVPYLVMEFVDGQTITDYVQARRLPWRERLGLLLDTARAVDAAHQQLIVHRDIKPSNVMVDAGGQVKLLDFGIAKLLDQEDTNTRSSVGLMTPAYAAPEQIAYQPISTATDVHALGLLLYELLIGAKPDRSGHWTRPSEHARQLATTLNDLGVRAQTRQLSRYLKGDLDNILMKALDPEPRNRYRDAGSFADDLKLFLAGRPVLAHAPSNWYRVSKFAQRHRGAVAVTAALVLALIASMAMTLWQFYEAQVQARNARQEAVVAQRQAARADSVKSFLLSIFSAAEARLPEDRRPTVADLVATAGAQLPARNDLDPQSRADVLRALAQIAALIDDDQHAIDYLKQASSLLADNPESARAHIQAQAELASVLARLDRLDEAQQVLDPIRSEVGVHDAASQTALLALAGFHEEKGELDQAIQFAETAQSRARGADGIRPGTILASLYNRAGRYPQAAEVMDRTLKAQERLALPEDIQYARNLAAMGNIELNQGKMPEGIARLDQAIALRRTIVDGPSRETGEMLKSRAAAFEAISQFEPAMRDAREALDQFNSLYAPDHSLVLSAKLMVASVTRDLEGPKAAIPLYLAIIEICKRGGFEERSTDCGLTYGNLANAYVHLGQLNEALTASRNGLRIRAKLLGTSHPSYAMALAGQSSVLYGLKQYNESLEVLDEAIRIHRTQNLNGTAAFGRMLRNRADTLLRLERPDEALAALVEQEPLLAQYSQGNARHHFEWHAFRAFAFYAKHDLDKALAAAQEAQKFEVPRVTMTEDRWALFQKIADGK